MYDNLTDSQLFSLHTELHGAASDLHDRWTLIFHMSPKAARVVHNSITAIRNQQFSVYTELEARGALHDKS